MSYAYVTWFSCTCVGCIFLAVPWLVYTFCLRACEYLCYETLYAYARQKTDYENYWGSSTYLYAHMDHVVWMRTRWFFKEIRSQCMHINTRETVYTCTHVVMKFSSMRIYIYIAKSEKWRNMIISVMFIVVDERCAHWRLRWK